MLGNLFIVINRFHRVSTLSMLFFFWRINRSLLTFFTNEYFADLFSKSNKTCHFFTYLDWNNLFIFFLLRKIYEQFLQLKRKKRLGFIQNKYEYIIIFIKGFIKWNQLEDERCVIMKKGIMKILFFFVFIYNFDK